MLEREFEARHGQDARYSLRAFARDLGISPASLSLVLNRKQGLSSGSAMRIAEKLNLSADERHVFRDLALREHARSQSERERAKIRLAKREPAVPSLQLDAFKLMSEWYHLTLLELTEVEGFQSSPEWIARSLGISRKATTLAIQRLKRLGLLEERAGRLRQTQGFMATPGGIPSEAVRKFHGQMLDKAKKALHNQALDERDFSTIVFPMRKADLEWAKVKLQRFRRGLMRQLERAPSKNRVYCLSIQLFNVQQEHSS